MRHALWTVLVLALLSPDASAKPMVVVLDPGHGGTNLGAISPVGLKEKQVTLYVARVLARTLWQVPGVRVVLTRNRDEYLTLSERVRIANRAGGHLFLSLHVNASPQRNQRGFEAFVLSPAATRLQERPRAWGGLTRALAHHSTALHLEVTAAVADLRRSGHRRQGMRLGGQIMEALGSVVGARHSRGLQEGRFDVLMGLRMPGVLVELGFLDHPVEGRLLADRAYLVRLTGALARAVVGYGAMTHGLTPRVGIRLDRGLVQPAKHPSRKDRRRPAPGEGQGKPPANPVVAVGSSA